MLQSVIFLGLSTFFTLDFNVSWGIFQYRYIILSLFMFYIGGMALARYRDILKTKSILNFTPFYAGIFVIFTILTRSSLNWVLKIISGVVYIFGSVLFIGSLNKTRYLKTKRFYFIEKLGSLSYSLYLFQPIFYILVVKITNFNFFQSLIITLICFPLFFVVCFHAEKIMNNELGKLIG